MRFKKIKYLSIPLLTLVMTVPIFADRLPDGSVRGLPQNLIVMDEDGNSVSASGDYYVHIEDMQPRVLYTKDITVMNLRNDAVYRVYMSAAPDHTEGEIDLEGEVEVKLYLENELIYEGDVNGDGTPNMQLNPIDLGGIYNSDEQRKLHAEFIWNITDETEALILGKTDRDKPAFGAVDFRWIFTAQVNENGGEKHNEGEKEKQKNDSDKNGGGNGGIRGKITQKGEFIPTDTTEPSKPDTSEQSTSETETTQAESTVEVASDVEGDEGSIDETDTSKDSDDEIKEEETDVFEKIAEDIPFIPEDVKTGYHSKIVLYLKLLTGCGIVAILLTIGIIYKNIKLKNRNNKI